MLPKNQGFKINENYDTYIVILSQLLLHNGKIRKFCHVAIFIRFYYKYLDQ